MGGGQVCRVARTLAEEAFPNSFNFFGISWKITQNLFPPDSRGLKKRQQCSETDQGQWWQQAAAALEGVSRSHMW